MTTTNGTAEPQPALNAAELQAFTTFVDNIWCSRQEFFSRFGDPRRDVDRECGYPSTLEASLYRALYDRTGPAERVVELLPRECWQVTPEVYEDEDAKTATLFEKAWDELGGRIQGSEESFFKDEEGSPVWSYLLRLDILAGIGSFGLLLFGLNDGLSLDQPVPGYKPAATVPVGEDLRGSSSVEAAGISPLGTDAQYGPLSLTPGTAPADAAAKGRPLELLFLRVFDESQVQIAQFDGNPYSPRYGQPLIYNVTFNNPHEVHSGIGLTTATLRVHWSRVLHVADHLGSSEVFGKPRLQPVLNNILDLRKLYGGSAEMYWQGAFPGLSIETHPSLGGDVMVDRGQLREMMQDYRSKLQRWISLMGMSAKSLAPQVVDPGPQIEVQIEAICITLGVPVRVFKGSERGELASSQDDASWNDRLRHRQHTYLTPKLIVPFANRLIAFGILPPPKQFHVRWPDLDSVTDKDKSLIALQDTQALAAYVAGNVEAVVPPQDYLTRVLGWEEDAAATVLEAANELAEEKQQQEQEQEQKQAVEAAQLLPPPGPVGKPAAGKAPPVPAAAGRPGMTPAVPTAPTAPKLAVNLDVTAEPLYVEMRAALRKILEG